MLFIKTLGALAALTTVGVAQSTFTQPNPFVMTLNYTALNIADPRLNPTDFFTTAVSFANNSLYIGRISTELYSEPFYAISDSGGIEFKSYHQSPTGFTSLYLFPNGTQPVALTIPHSGFVPLEASNNGFGWDCEGYLTYNGVNNFFGCPDVVPNSYQISWLASGKVGDNSDCLGPLALFRTNVTLSPEYYF